MATDPRGTETFSIGLLPDPCEDAGTLEVKAKRCRRLAAGISDRQAAEVLNRMAESYEQAAARLNAAAAAPPASED